MNLQRKKAKNMQRIVDMEPLTVFAIGETTNMKIVDAERGTHGYVELDSGFAVFASPDAPLLETAFPVDTEASLKTML